MSVGGVREEVLKNQADQWRPQRKGQRQEVGGANVVGPLPAKHRVHKLPLEDKKLASVVIKKL